MEPIVAGCDSFATVERYVGVMSASTTAESFANAGRPTCFLTPVQAAERLGITAATLYDWLGQSRRGLLVIRGQAVTIEYFQGGAKGQGRIRIAETEVERIQELMRVPVQSVRLRRPPIRQAAFPGITVSLGRPPG